MPETVKRPAPKGGKGSTLNARITGETRRALEMEAAATGRSLSQVAEVWLEEARLLSGMGQTGRSISDGVVAMVRFASLVHKEIGDPGQDLIARDALLAGWRNLIGLTLPYTPDTPEGLKVRELQLSLRERCRLAELTVSAAAATGPEMLAILQDIGRPTMARRFPDKTGALGPWIQNRAGPTLQEAIARLQATPEEARLAQNARDLAVAAAKTIPELQTILDELVESIDELARCTREYFAPRSAAAERGRLLSEMFGGVPDIEGKH